MQITVNGRALRTSLLPTAEILKLYNDMAFEMGEPSVNRFANRSKAESRLVGIVDRYNEFLAKRPVAEKPAVYGDEMKAAADEAAKAIVGLASPGEPVQVSQTITPSADGASVTVDTQVTVQLDTADKAQIKSEAASRPAAKPVASGGPRWARAKYEAPAKVAYRPRAGSSQAVMYGLLTRPNGINIYAFCEEMKQFRDKTLHAPATVWSCLRYLFVTSKGYGLNFDGTNISLIRPADERDAVRANQEAAA